MKTKAPRFELPAKWQTLDRLNPWGTPAWAIISEVWPHGVILTVKGDDDDPPDTPTVKVEVKVWRDESPKNWRGPELHYRLVPEGEWVSHHSVQRAALWMGHKILPGHADAIDRAVGAEFKRARARWLKAQRESGVEQEVRRQEYEAAYEEEARLRDEVEEVFTESAAWCGRVSGGSEDDEDWRQFWHTVDKLGVVVARARAAIKARQRAEGRLQ